MMKTTEAYNLLKEIFLILDEGDQQLFAQHSLSVTRYYTLYHVTENPGMSLSDLSRLMLCDKSNVTRIVKSLEKSGYLLRQPHETDRRATRLFLTPKGQAKESAVRVVHQEFTNNRLQVVLDQLSNEELKRDLEIVKKYLEEERAVRLLF